MIRDRDERKDQKHHKAVKYRAETDDDQRLGLLEPSVFLMSREAVPEIYFVT